jgi:sarcosine oxidase, subunit beta
VTTGEHAGSNAPFLWRSPVPKPSYDVVVVGGGLHGLATAYCLARHHGLTRVAVVERGWLGGGNAVRNTAMIRSNYLRDESMAVYDLAVRLWETLGEELECDLLFDQRGLLGLVHSEPEARAARRRISANRLAGLDAEWLDPQEVRRFCPVLSPRDDIRHPVLGASLQRRGGIARHDATVFALARAADALGVDLLQGCEVTAIDLSRERAVGVVTSQGRIGAGRVALAGAGRSWLLARLAGVDLPVHSTTLQALVSEILDQVLPCAVISTAVHVYVSQAHKGELVMGGARDPYVSYAQRGSFHLLESQIQAALELFPVFSRAHVLRTWGGTVDVTPDSSPIVGLTPVRDLFVNCGWGTGGFKATPAAGRLYAHTIAHGTPHPLLAPFGLDRFQTGAVVDEAGAASVGH